MTNFSRRNIHGERDVTIDKHVHASRKATGKYGAYLLENEKTPGWFFVFVILTAPK